MTSSWLFVGPNLLAGIGQVTNRYANLLQKSGHTTEYVEIGQTPKLAKYDTGFAVVLPIDN